MNADAAREIADSVLNDSASYTTDISLLALQAEVANLDGWNPDTDSTNVSMTAWEASTWAENLLAFLSRGATVRIVFRLRSGMGPFCSGVRSGSRR